MKKLFIIIFLLCGLMISLKSFAVEEKKNIAVFILDTPVNGSSYAIYPAAVNMFASDLVNSLRKYGDVNVIDMDTGKKIIQASGLEQEYGRLEKQYKQKYTVNYEKLDKIAQTMGVSHVVFVYGGFDTQKDFLKSNWKYRCQWIWANPVSSSAELNIGSTLIDTQEHIYVLEDNARKDIPMSVFHEPATAFGENPVPVSKIKKFTGPSAALLADKIHKKIYPTKQDKYSQKDAFVDKFTPNNEAGNPETQNTDYAPANNNYEFAPNNNVQGVTGTDNSLPATNTKGVNYSRTEKFKDWVQEKL